MSGWVVPLSLFSLTCILFLSPLPACSFSLFPSPSSSSPSPSASSVPHHSPSPSSQPAILPSRGTTRSPSSVPLGFVVRNPSLSSSSSTTSIRRSSSASPVLVSPSSNVCSSSSSSCSVSARQTREAISSYLSASPGPRGGEPKTSSAVEGVSSTQKNPSSFALTLRSYLRCHMSLLSDSSPTFNNGNLVFLFRAADAHDRLISPLELQTNKHHLPGHQAARTMAILEQQALQYAVEEQEDQGRDKAKPGTAKKIPENQTELFRSELLKFEIRRLHRILQFTCAARLRGEVLDKQSTKVMYDLLNVRKSNANERQIDLVISTAPSVCFCYSYSYLQKSCLDLRTHTCTSGVPPLSVCTPEATHTDTGVVGERRQGRFRSTIAMSICLRAGDRAYL